MEAEAFFSTNPDENSQCLAVYKAGLDSDSPENFSNSNKKIRAQWGARQDCGRGQRMWHHPADKTERNGARQKPEACCSPWGQKSDTTE